MMIVRNLIQVYVCLTSLTLAKDVLIIGPEKDEHLILPSRYYLLFHRIPIEKISVAEVNNGHRCRLWTQVFNETDFCIKLDKNNFERLTNNSRPLLISELFNVATFCDINDEDNDDQDVYRLTIVRLKLYQQIDCDSEVKLLIQTPEKLLTSSIGNRLMSDSCRCSLPHWPQVMRCSAGPNKALFQQIHSDLKTFSNGINFESVLDEAVKRFGHYPKTYSICLYQIISNQLYKKCFGEYDGFSKFFDEMLGSLLRKVELSDTEFIANLGDWPLSAKNKPPALPIFSWCGNADYNDIVVPTYELTESILHSPDRLSTDILSTFGQQPVCFEKKKSQVFWRGRDSNRSRLRLIELARKQSQLFNVSITNFFFFRDQIHLYSDHNGTKSEHVPFSQFFHYRYQLNIDGTVAAYRFPFLLAGNSLVLKQHSPYYEFFYSLLQPTIHYIDVDSNLDQLLSTVSNLIHSESSQAKRIIWNARRFVLEHLLPENIYCYYYNSLQAYTELLKQKPKLREAVQLVSQPNNGCNCDFRTSQKDEL